MQRAAGGDRQSQAGMQNSLTLMEAWDWEGARLGQAATLAGTDKSWG